MKNSFLVYNDQGAVFNELTDEKAGKLIKAMIDYSITGVIPKLLPTLTIAFIPIKQQMDRNSVRYEEMCEKNRENIQKRWSKNTLEYERIRPSTKHTDKDTDKDKDKGKCHTLASITTETISSLASKYFIAESDVQKTFDDLKLHCESKNVKYSNYRAELEKFIRSDLESKKIIPMGPSETLYESMTKGGPL